MRGKWQALATHNLGISHIGRQGLSGIGNKRRISNRGERHGAVNAFVVSDLCDGSLILSGQGSLGSLRSAHELLI